MRCPNCNGRSIGRVGTEQYYCWDCCVEFSTARGGLRIYHLDAEGELTAAASVDPNLTTNPAQGLHRP